MRAVDKSELERLRRRPAVEVLLELADHAKVDRTFTPASSHATSRWHARVGSAEFELLLNGVKFWDTRAAKGGGGAIDLAMHLYGATFKRAIEILRERSAAP